MEGVDPSYSYQAPDGVGSIRQSLRAQDGGRSRHAERGASNMHSAGLTMSLARTFTRNQRASAKRAKEGAKRQI